MYIMLSTRVTEILLTCHRYKYACENELLPVKLSF